MHDGYPDIGEILGEGYRLEAVLGTGRASRVYRAEQVAMSRPVAVKVLSPLLVRDALLAKRFEQEIRLGVHLNHPNLVALYDAGSWLPADAPGDAPGLPFLVMELLEGCTLRDYIAGHPQGLPVERCGEIARHVLAGLAEMHAAGIVHRDISPTNVFICDLPGSDSIAKVLDFSVAKVVAENNATGLTAIDTVEFGGGLVGSPRYMAPEMVQEGDVSASADLYSFGLLMAEMVTGEPVVKDRTRVAMVAQLKLGKYPTLPASLQRSPLAPVLQRCICPEPDERYATCEDLLCDLVLVGMGTSETVRFSTHEALMRYEERRKNFEQRPTSRMDPVEKVSAGPEAAPEEAVVERPGLAKIHGGAGRASQDMRASVPGMTQRVDREKVLLEAQEKLGHRLQTTSDTSVDLKAVKLDDEGDYSGRLLYGVAVLALILTVALLAVTLFWLLWQGGAA